MLDHAWPLTVQQLNEVRGNSCGSPKREVSANRIFPAPIGWCIHYGIKIKSLRSIAMRKGRAGEGSNRN